MFDDLASPTGTLPTVSGSFVVGQTYVIETLGTTNFTLIGATSVNAGSFTVGTQYVITTLGSTDWNNVAGTTGETYVVGDRLIAQTAGSGTGVALNAVFEATGPGTGTGTAYVGYDAPSQIPASSFNANELIPGNSYEITSLGTTDWNDVAGSTGWTYNVGDIVLVVNAGSGTGTADTVNSAYDESLNWLVLSSGSTSSFNIGDSILFTANPDMLGGIVSGRTYYITEIWSSTEFVVSETPGGSPVVLTNDTGTMQGDTNPFYVIAITNVDNTITAPLATTVATATSSTGNEITVLSTAEFIPDQTVDFKGTSVFGGIVAGQIYFVDTVVNGTTFTIKDKDGNPVALTNASGTMIVTVGGSPTVTVAVAPAGSFELNTRVRIGGVTGSTQLNGNAYYIRPITDTLYQLWLEPYQTGLNDPNYPVTNVSNYTGGGYIWQQGILYLVSAYATNTTSGTNTITVLSTENLVENTPVYFSRAGEQDGTNLLGGLEQGVEYFVKSIYDEFTFSVSETQYGEEMTLTTDTGFVNVTQWNQKNVERIYVTINGYRVPSSKLALNDYNEVSILAPVSAGDVVIMTNMIPTATPNQETYINFVNQDQEASVYRENVGNKTFLTQAIYDLSTEIYVSNVDAVTDQVIQHEVTPSAIDGKYNFGLTANRNLILAVQVYNNSTAELLDNAFYSVVIEDLAPILKIEAGSYIAPGDQLTITTVEGGTIFVNGEQINFGSVDLYNNTLGNLQRGANGTAKQYLIPQYTTVYGLIGENRLPDAYYDATWNPIPGIYNTTEGDPLQIAETVPALFLRSDAIE